MGQLMDELPVRACGRMPVLFGPNRRSVVRNFSPLPRLHAECDVQAAPPKTTSLVVTVPAVRPGADWYDQYRFVCAMTMSGGGAPQAV